jgi:Acetyltransferase (GNAT) domain
MRAQGYADPAYAQSLAEFGAPVFLPGSGGSVLARQIPDTSDLLDAMGPYPLFDCVDWHQLGADLEGVSDRLVCVSLVADPFGDWTPNLLEDCFPDLMAPFKDHFVVDLSVADSYNSHHQRNVRRALRTVEVEAVSSPREMLAEWVDLYDNLVVRHSIRGVSAFSPSVFAAQLALPCLLAFRARHDDETVGAILWIVKDDVAYYHLGAYSDLGYQLGASFALFATALAHLAGVGVHWASLGAGAGLNGSESSDGLTRFKSGWATHTRIAYLCGRVLQRGAYEQLSRPTGHTEKSYFPAYRAGEFE